MDENEFRQIDAVVNRLIAGHESARKELIEISYDRLKKLARKMLKQFPAVRRWEETDDVFQRAALRLWQSLEKIQPEDSRHYFNLAALQVRRELIELARSLSGPMGLGKNQESRSDEETNRGGVADNIPASDSCEAGRLAAWSNFHQKIDDLEGQDKEVFSLIWYQGLSQAAVASLLGISQRTVSRRWQVASRTLYGLLDGQLPT